MSPEVFISRQDRPPDRDRPARREEHDETEAPERERAEGDHGPDSAPPPRTVDAPEPPSPADAERSESAEPSPPPAPPRTRRAARSSRRASRSHTSARRRSRRERSRRAVRADRPAPTTVLEGLPHPGDVVGSGARSYRILREIGRGATGVVFEAERTDGLPARFAIKVPRTPRAVDRIVAEARAATRIEHHRIARVVDAQPDGDPPFIVLERAARGDLRRALVEADGRFPVDRALALFRAVGGAVAYAHERGVIHGDLKPENVLIDEDGDPKVCDFGAGVAREERAACLANSLTGLDDDLVGRVRGTFGYLAPELWDGARPTTRTDVFSLGVLLYELLTGRRPVGSFAPARRHAAGVPDWLDAILERALAADPEDRPADASVLVGEIERARCASAALAAAAAEADAVADAVIGAMRGSRATEHRRAIRRLEEVRDEAMIHGLIAPVLAARERRRRPLTAGAIGVWAAILVGSFVSVALGSLGAAPAALQVAIVGFLVAWPVLPVLVWLLGTSARSTQEALERARRALPSPLTAGPLERSLGAGPILLPLRLRRLVQAERRLGLREAPAGDRPPRPTSSRLAVGRDRSASAFRPGQLVGPWVLESLLGAGAHGEVWRARPVRRAEEDPNAEDPFRLESGEAGETAADGAGPPPAAGEAPEVVALKLPRNAASVGALARERDATRLLPDAEGFRRVVASDLDASPAWVAMELIEGRDLAVLLDDDGPFPAPEATRLVLELADSLAIAHEAGLVHGDLSPRNVIVDADGHPHLSDLGAARSLDELRQGISFSLSMSVHGTGGFAALGTLSCTAPEVLDGQRPDFRSDIYSLGAVAYAAFTGRRPVGCLGPLEAGELPRALADVVRRCLDPDRTRRYANAASAARAIRRALAFVDLRVSRALADLDPDARYAYYRLAEKLLAARVSRQTDRPLRTRLLRLLVHARRERERADDERRAPRRGRAGRGERAVEPSTPPRRRRLAGVIERSIWLESRQANMLGRDVVCTDLQLAPGIDEPVLEDVTPDDPPDEAATHDAAPAPARSFLAQMFAGAIESSIKRESRRLSELGRDTPDPDEETAETRSLLDQLLRGRGGRET